MTVGFMVDISNEYMGFINQTWSGGTWCKLVLCWNMLEYVGYLPVLHGLLTTY
jgi:hypothetical protein